MKTGALVSEAEKYAEKALVGFALYQSRRAMDLEVEAHHFSEPRWARAWAAIREMAAEGALVDPVSVADRMEAQGTQAMCDLAEAALQPGVLPETYAGIVRDGWVTRQVLQATRDIYQAHAEGLGGPELLSKALELIAAIQVEQPAQATTIGELVKTRYRELAELAQAKERGEAGATGILTGIRPLDDLLGGLQRGICTVVAARPGVGKSALGQALSDHASASGIGVHVFSLEDTRSAYTDRAMSRESGVPSESIRICEMDHGQMSRLGTAAQNLFVRRGWVVDDRGAITAEEIVRSVRRELGANKTQVVIVDYVQLLKAPPGFAHPGDKTAVVDHAMNVLADAAKQDNLVYLVLAQLNRECEKRDNKRPMLSDLKQSGAIEERAKAVLMLYRPYLYRERDPKTNLELPESQIEILVRKNNHGRVGKVLAHWDGPLTRID